MTAVNRKTKTRQRPTKSSKKRGFYVPLAERLRIIAEYASGGVDNSIRKLADRYKRDEGTISRIVKSPEAEKAGLAVMTQILEGAMENVAERINYEVKNKHTKNGAWVAMELAEKFGAIPNNKKQAPLPPDPVSQDKRVRTWVEKLTDQAMERGKQFGMPMPEMEETETEIRLDEKP